MKKILHSFKTTILAIGIMFPFIATSQAVIDVNVLSMSFSPANITIDLGDTVRWTSSSGTHNVNGTLATFPSNPETFGNSLSSGWTYSHKFLTAGTYSYRCDQHFASGMVGTITVQDVSGIKENSTSSISIYPNPSNGIVNVKLSENMKGSNYVITNLSGAIVQSGEGDSKIEINNLQSGIYLIVLTSNNSNITERFVIQ